MQAKGMGSAMQEVTMFANLCNISPEQVKTMTVRNYGRVQEAFKLFTD